MTKGKRSIVRRIADSGVGRGLANVSKNVLAAASALADEGLGTGLARVRRIIHDTEAGPFFQRIEREWKALVEDGKAKAERLAEPEVRTAFASLVDDLEQKIPDQRRLDILRRAFLGVAIGDPKDQDGTMGLLFLGVARRLTGEEAIVLGNAYRRRQAGKGQARGDTAGSAWVNQVMDACGIPFREQFFMICDSLIKHRLVLGSAQGEVLVWGGGEDGVFSPFGVAFCQFLERSEPLEPPASA